MKSFITIVIMGVIGSALFALPAPAPSFLAVVTGGRHAPGSPAQTFDLSALGNDVQFIGGVAVLSCRPDSGPWLADVIEGDMAVENAAERIVLLAGAPATAMIDTLVECGVGRAIYAGTVYRRYAARGIWFTVLPASRWLRIEAKDGAAVLALEEYPAAAKTWGYYE